MLKYPLTVLATLSVTTATVDRSFSTLNRTKTYIRNSTGKERLTVLSIHGELDAVNPNEVFGNMEAKNFENNILNFPLSS